MAQCGLCSEGRASHRMVEIHPVCALHGVGGHVRAARTAQAVEEAGLHLPTLQGQGSFEWECVQPSGYREAGAAEVGSGVLPFLGASIVARKQGVEVGLGLVAAEDALRLREDGERLEVVGACCVELGLPQAMHPVMQSFPLGPELACPGPIKGPERVQTLRALRLPVL
jgi:hypothetical protein